MTIHTIRLRALWQRQIRDDRRLWRRVFGRPVDLPEGDTVRLVLHPQATGADVILNGQLLGHAAAEEERVAFEITAAMLARNELLLHEDRPNDEQDAGSQSPLDVSLEFESPEPGK